VKWSERVLSVWKSGLREKMASKQAAALGRWCGFDRPTPRLFGFFWVFLKKIVIARHAEVKIHGAGGDIIVLTEWWQEKNLKK